MTRLRTRGHAVREETNHTGILSWILLGLVVGGYLATLLGLGAVTGFDLGSLAIAIAGAILVLLIHRKIRG